MQITAPSPVRRGLITTIFFVLALGIAAWAQRWLTDSSVPLDGRLGYLVAIVLYVLALARKPVHVLQDEPRRLAVPAISSIVRPRWRSVLYATSAGATVLAYLAFGRQPGCALNFGYCFTPLNTTLWLIALGSFLLAAWDWDATRLAEAWERVRGWRVTLSWVGLAFIGIMLIAAWFRFYQLDAIPADPTSDHAEKLLDVYDVLQGGRPVFFIRNTGRELFQFYYTAGLIWLFDLRTDHLALKLGTALISLLTIPFVFLLGREVGGTGMGLLTAFLTAISKWHVAISRVGLRFPFTAAFAIPTLFFTLRGLRLNRRNDWLLAGVFLGVGLHTYTSMRIVPLLVGAIIGLRLVWDWLTWRRGEGRSAPSLNLSDHHPNPLPQGEGTGGEGTGREAGSSPLPVGEGQGGQSEGLQSIGGWRDWLPPALARRLPANRAPVTPTLSLSDQTSGDPTRPATLTRPFWTNVACMGVVTFLLFFPLFRYSIERPEQVWFRSLTRASTTEVGQAFNPVQRLGINLWNALLQFNYRGDTVWVNTVPWDPQLDPITGALFALGIIYGILVIAGRVSLPGGRVLGIYEHRRFIGAALLLSLFMLLLPSILALAFPIENPSVVRGGGAPPVVMIFAAVPLLLAARALRENLETWGALAAAVLIGALLLGATVLNYKQYFEVYDNQLRRAGWNANEMADVLEGFVTSVGDIDHAWVVAWPNWVDTRNVFFQMGAIPRNNYLPVEQGGARAATAHAADPAPKMYLLHPQDQGGIQVLRQIFSQGQAYTYYSRTPGKDFLVFFVPGTEAPR